MSFENEWKEFLDCLDEPGPSPEDEASIRRTFYAGAYATLGILNRDISKLGGFDAMHAFVKLNEEVKDWLRSEVAPLMPPEDN